MGEGRQLVAVLVALFYLNQKIWWNQKSFVEIDTAKRDMGLADPVDLELKSRSQKNISEVLSASVWC